ncbi:MAG: hypothetical protein P1U77_18960 [Rubripirellula sp.]|nr:hypothetical protein [Rubripirellula sp.]
MLAEYKQKTNIGIGVGLLMQIAGNFVSGGTTAGSGLVGLFLLLGGLGLFIWGCVSYAVGKGHHGALGLLGVFSILGLIVLILLPDKHK